MKRLFLAMAFIAATPSALSFAAKAPGPQLHEIVHAVIQCESGGRHIWSEVDFNPPSFGILQYQSETFYRHARQAGLKNADWKNEGDQITLFLWALENGKGNEWTCFRNLKREGKI